MTTALEAARAYVARGWNPLPLPFKSKIPTDTGWQKRVIGASRPAPIFQRASPECRRCPWPFVGWPDRPRPRLPGGHRDRAVHIAEDWRNLWPAFRPRVALALLFVALLQAGQGDDPVPGPDEAA